MLQKKDARNTDIIVNINGHLTHRDEARVSPFDASVQNGDGVWEGLRVYDGRIFRLREHLTRLRQSAMALGYVSIPTDDVIIEQISRTLEANGMRDGVHIRLTLTRGVKYTSGLDPRLNQAGHTLIVLAEHKPPVYDKNGITLKTAAHRRPPSDVLDQTIHSCNQLTSILAKLEANAAGADDALMLDTRGFVAETNATHLFFVAADTVSTPTTAACPAGITRSVILELCTLHHIPCVVRDVTLAEAYRADEVFCTGTMGEIAAVTTIDGRQIGSQEAGPVTRKLAALFRELTQTEGERVIP
ncbi:MAG: aminotransferase class IV [Phycisphaerales bacterium]|nr:aminotransferase class IV [Phycisphaerales bacterium]